MGRSLETATELRSLSLTALIEKLRDGVALTTPGDDVDLAETNKVMDEAAARLERLERQLARLEKTKPALPGHAPLTDPISFDLCWNDAIDTAIAYVRAALLDPGP